MLSMCLFYIPTKVFQYLQKFVILFVKYTIIYKLEAEEISSVLYF